jgi:hypothetical protein
VYVYANDETRTEAMPRNEHLTRVELIDPALHDLGWTGELLREEKTPGGSEVIDVRPVKRPGRRDYLLLTTGIGSVKMQANPFFYSVVQTEFGETVVVRRQDRDRLPVCRIILPVSGRAASKWVKHEFPGAVFNPDTCVGICRQILDFLEGKEVVFEAADIDFGIVDGFAKRVLTMAAGQS